MGKARGLFLAVAGAASLVVACATHGRTLRTWTGPLRMRATFTPRRHKLSRAQEGCRAPMSQSRRRRLPRSRRRTALGSPQNGPSRPTDRLSLAQQLQRELARVGCYEGELNGMWTPAARKAMKAFMDRVNATLPIEEPDYILLSLVQAARDRVCGTGCPTGQGLAEEAAACPTPSWRAKRRRRSRAPFRSGSSPPQRPRAGR